MRSGTSDASHLLSVWRTSGFRGLDKPVVRFLRHGGAFAGDLIARMWQLAEDVADMGMSDARVRGTETLAHDAGLPPYLVEKLLQGEHEPVRRGPQLPRPALRIDPYDGRGPYLELPPAPRHDGSWILSGRGDALRRVRISQRDSRELPLGPDSPWNVELRTSIAERLWTFAGMHAAPVYFFAEDGKIAGNQESLRGTSVLALAIDATSFLTSDGAAASDGAQHTEPICSGASAEASRAAPDTPAAPVRELDELPPLVGDWSGWRLQALDLTGLYEVLVVCPAQPHLDLEEIRTRLPVTASAARPRIVPEPLDGARDSGGRPVYPSPPKLQMQFDGTSPMSWRIRFRPIDGPPETLTLAELASQDDTYSTAPVFPEMQACSGRLEVVGPLGSDLREDVCVVPGVAFAIPDRLVGPEEQSDVEVTADVPLDPDGRTHVALAYPPGCDTQELPVGPARDDLRIQISIPRSLWTLSRRVDARASFGHECARIGLDDLESGDVEAVLVRLRRREQVSLELHAHGQILQATQIAWTRGPEGRWSFPLAEFRDTAVHAGVDRLHLRLRAGELAVDVAVIEAVYEVSDLRCESIVDPADNTAALRRSLGRESQDSGTVSFGCGRSTGFGRGRPSYGWTTVRTVAPTSSANRLSPPAPTLLELSIHDPWAPPPMRPRVESSNTTVVHVGSYTDLSLHLNGLDPSSPMHALELEMAGRGPLLKFDSRVAGEIYERISMTLDVLSEMPDRSPTEESLLRRLLEFELAEPRRLAYRLSEDLDEDSEGSLRHLLALLPGILASPPTEMGDELMERLWRTNPVAGAAFDSFGTDDGEALRRWESHTGWNPSGPTECQADNDSLYLGGPIAPFHEWQPERLRELAAAMPPSRFGRLLFTGFFSAACDFLTSTWTDRSTVTTWRATVTPIPDRTYGMTTPERDALERLASANGSPAWCRFPHDLQAAAFHLLAFPRTKDATVNALSRAMGFAQGLTRRCLLVAIALYHQDRHARS